MTNQYIKNKAVNNLLVDGEEAACAFCRSKNLNLIMDFGEMALAGGFLKIDGFKAEKKFPMRLCFCEDCAGVQLIDVISADILFNNYFYFSSAIGSLREHFADYATEVVTRFLDPESSTVVEIGCNDGVLLKPMADQKVRTVIGVDPAKNVVNSIDDPRVITFNEFFSKELASTLEEKYGKADMIVANNVFAHIPDIRGVSEAIQQLLSDDGVFLFEVHYLGNIINGYQYDMVYHEHMYYYSLIAVENFFREFGMVVFDVKSIPIHAGSMRFYVCKNGSKHSKEISSRVAALRENELKNGFHKAETFQRFAADVEGRKSELMQLLDKLRQSGKRVVGYGASGRANTIIQYCGVEKDHMEYMVDDAPAKSGFYTPGSHFLIKNSDAIYTDMPDYLLIFAWGYFPEISKKHRDYFIRGGKAILPLPDVRVTYKP